ncbi:MAG: ELWxxDGT repeat protein [Cyanobacteria bacterium P01_G01_bin.39]
MASNQNQVVLVKDINLGISDEGEGNGSFLKSFTEYDDKLYFSANDGEHGEELWVSDGTTAGTRLVANINPGVRNDGFGYSSLLSGFTEYDGKLYFSANDGETGGELWVSDGTSSGTQLVADINPEVSGYGYPFDSSVSQLTVFDDKLYFTANDGEKGNELWVSDGTKSGTQLVADINPEESDYGYIFGSSISYLTEYDDKLYFTADDGKHGNELWVSDGTTEGTKLVADINPDVDSFENPLGSRVYGLTEFNDKLYFTADDGEHGAELWVSDGTTEGTQLLVDINPKSNEYGAYGSYTAGFTVFNDKLYFTADDGEHGNELWVSDGTTEGTQLLVDINPGAGNYGVNSSYAAGFTEFNDKLYFNADDGQTGGELWVSDGTKEGTQLLADIDPKVYKYSTGGSFPNDFTEFEDQLYFTTGDYGSRELWVSDGTTKGTQFIVDLNPRTESGNQYGYGYDYGYGYTGTNLAVVNNVLFFSANDGDTGAELYRLDSANSSVEDVIITGTDNADRLIGSPQDDHIEGLKGRDTLKGQAGNDVLDGGSDRDFLLGSDGRDTLIGGNGNDLLRGQSGKDVLEGNAGNDTLMGGNHFDRLGGGDGDDFLDGVGGTNVYNGGSGSDTFVVYKNSQPNWVQDFELGIDRIGLAEDLTWSQLEITGRSNSLISYQGEQIGILLGINPDNLDSSDFFNMPDVN